MKSNLFLQLKRLLLDLREKKKRFLHNHISPIDGTQSKTSSVSKLFQAPTASVWKSQPDFNT